ncbi:MAG: carboxypeptidase regulatory-like domain-containing protein, partial [Bacteroidaceae bacterium]|nr:carboxypeptidase regulatory-like domain-containing protein [Bacteroidaceae bacterium]
MAVLLPLAACAQLLTRNYQHQPLPEVLIDIDNASPELQISFIYDKLEDYTVTCSFTDVSPIEAIHCAVGFYPVKINRSNNLITIEPIYDTGQSLKGRLVSERGEGVEFADISVFTLPDTSYVASAISTEGGDFVIPLEREGDLWMKVRRMGYLPLSRPVKVG